MEPRPEKVKSDILKKEDSPKFPSTDESGKKGDFVPFKKERDHLGRMLDTKKSRLLTFKSSQTKADSNSEYCDTSPVHKMS